MPDDKKQEMTTMQKLAIMLSSAGKGLGQAGGGDIEQVSAGQSGGLLPSVAPPLRTGGLPTGIRGALSGGPVTGAPPPSAYPTIRPGAFDTGFEFQTKGGRNAAIAAGTISNVMQAVGQFKQQRWDKRRATTDGFTRRIIGLLQNDDPEMQKLGQSMLQDPKIMKHFAKAIDDPTSAEAIGLGDGVEAMKAKSGRDMMAEIQQRIMQAQGAFLGRNPNAASMIGAKQLGIDPNIGALDSAQTGQAARVGAGIEPSADVQKRAEAEIESAKIRSSRPQKGPTVLLSQDVTDRYGNVLKSGTQAQTWTNPTTGETEYTPLAGTTSSATGKETKSTTVHTIDDQGNSVDVKTTKSAPVPISKLQQSVPSGVAGPKLPVGSGKDQVKSKRENIIERMALNAQLYGEFPNNKRMRSIVESHMAANGMVAGIKPTAEILNRGLFAAQLTETRDNNGQTKFEHAYKLIDDLDKSKKLGPFIGRMNKIGSWTVGLDDPEFVALQANLELIAGAGARAHFGGRSGLEVFKKFDGMFAQQRTAANMKSVLRELESTLKIYAKVTHRGGQVQSNQKSSSGEESPQQQNLPPGWVLYPNKRQ